MRRMHTKLESLTAREREVLGLIGRGMSLPQIARQLHRSQKTVESHRLSLGRKLEASNRVELARIAITAGLAPLTENTPGHDDQLLSLRDSVAENTPAWRAIRTIDTSLTAATGQHYLRELPRLLSEQLHLRCGFVSQFTNTEDQPLQAVVLAWEGDHPHEWHHVALDKSPCAQAMRDGFVRFNDGVRERFPGTRLLEQTEAKGYIGVRLNGIRNRPVGIIGLTHDQPLDGGGQLEDVLRICASRAGAELERAHMDEKFLQLNQNLERRVRQRTAQLERQNRRLLETQRRLADSERKFRTLVETMSEGLAVMDADGVMTYVNPYFCELLGLRESEVLGHPPTEFIAYAEEAAWFAARDFERRQGTHGSYTVHLRHANGAVIACRVAPRSLYDDDNQYIGSFGVVSRIRTRQGSSQARE